MTIIVTGGAGFIGANFIHYLVQKNPKTPIINIDKLTYAGNLDNLLDISNNKNYTFLQGDIGDINFISKVLEEHKPLTIVNFAAESHVDRSILDPKNFIESNIVGTFHLLEAIKNYWSKTIPTLEKEHFRLLHISTDEIYGSLAANDEAFTEKSQIQPNSPYSASKAASDHLVRCYHHTYGLPVLTTNCSNNYGPYQFPEKLIPLVIDRALQGKDIPIYGDGLQIRDWLYVEDHCSAIDTVIQKGKLGEVYNIGGNNEVKNIDLVNLICKLLDHLIPRVDSKSYCSQITFVRDRPGHDKRYAINSSKIQEIGWKPKETISTGLEKTIKWYLSNTEWLNKVKLKISK